jgi:hemerythrin superfamily protein
MRHGNFLSAPFLPSSSLGDLLGEHHREIEAGCLEMMSGFADNARGLTLRWETVEYALLEHMAAEESTVFPVYRDADPRNERALLDQHALLRECALEIGLAIHLRTITGEHVQQFVDKLRAHARHEDASMYRWAQRNLDRNQRHTLRALGR